MTKKVPEQERARKEYSQRGTRGQRMMSFRCDNENLEYLNQQPNKGRLLNEIIREYREKNGGR